LFFFDHVESYHHRRRKSYDLNSRLRKGVPIH
jgi:hypothetical protein